MTMSSACLPYDSFHLLWVCCRIWITIVINNILSNNACLSKDFKTCLFQISDGFHWDPGCLWCGCELWAKKAWCSQCDLQFSWKPENSSMCIPNVWQWDRMFSKYFEMWIIYFFVIFSQWEIKQIGQILQCIFIRILRNSSTCVLLA